MRAIPRLPTLALVAMLLAGCGFKGDLVKPGEEPVPAKTGTAPVDPVKN